MGVPKWKFSTGKKHFKPGKKSGKMTLAPQKNFPVMPLPMWYTFPKSSTGGVGVWILNGVAHYLPVAFSRYHQKRDLLVVLMMNTYLHAFFWSVCFLSCLHSLEEYKQVVNYSHHELNSCIPILYSQKKK